MEEKTIQQRTIFTGRIFSVEQHQVRLDNGKETVRDIVKHPGAVGVLALTKEDKIILVKQYRKGVEQEMIEIPSGMLDKEGEEPLVAAQRELMEETKHVATKWHEIVTMAMSPGFLSEKVTLFYAEDAYEKELEGYTLDDDEFVEVIVATRDEVAQYQKNGQILDAKTLYAIAWWDLMRIKYED